MSSVHSPSDIPALMAQMGTQARAASAPMAGAGTAGKNGALNALARLLRQPNPALAQANQRDVEAAQAAGLAPPMVDPLGLDASRTRSWTRSFLILRLTVEVSPRRLPFHH